MSKTAADQGVDDYIKVKGIDALIEKVENTDEWTKSRELHKLNEEFVYVSGISMIAHLPNEDRPDVRFYKPQTWIAEVMANRTMKVGPDGDQKEVSAAAQWMKWKQRNEVDCVTYEPGKGRIIL